MLIACYNIYNEIEHLPTSVKAAYDKVDKIVFVDGRYKGFHEEKAVSSDDGTLDWINDKENDPDGKFQLIEAPEEGWEDQPTKRTAYFIGEKGDIYLVMDGHDVITSWRRPDLVLGVAGMARLDILDNDPPISVKQPRLIAHIEGIHYLTHAYILDGEDEFYLNVGWDQQSLHSPDGFDKKELDESYTLTLRHFGKQNKELQERRDQVSVEREKIEAFDVAKGLNYSVDSRVAIDRTTKKFFEYYRRSHIIQGIPVIPYDKMRLIVEAKANLFEKQQKESRERAGLELTKQVTCSICGWVCPSGMHLITHFIDEHPEEEAK